MPPFSFRGKRRHHVAAETFQRSGAQLGAAEIARHEGIAKRYVERLSRLAFVTPAIVEAICQGNNPAELNAETLLNRIDLPLEWPAQRAALGVK